MPRPTVRGISSRQYYFDANMPPRGSPRASSTSSPSQFDKTSPKRLSLHRYDAGLDHRARGCFAAQESRSRPSPQHMRIRMRLGGPRCNTLWASGRKGSYRGLAPSAYNTVHYGCPGPICSFGLDFLRAAAAPADRRCLSSRTTRAAMFFVHFEDHLRPRAFKRSLRVPQGRPEQERASEAGNRSPVPGL